MDMLHAWMVAQRELVYVGSAISGALDYNSKRWAALSSHFDEGAFAVDNNGAENQIRPWALGHKIWMSQVRDAVAKVVVVRRVDRSLRRTDTVPHHEMRTKKSRSKKKRPMGAKVVNCRLRRL
ncbi:transposase [Pseudomonas fluorescens]|nr:transposase [Pseudomonas fluorescens]